MKKITLATTLLIALTSLGLATTANAAEATDSKDAIVTAEAADTNLITFGEVSDNNAVSFDGLKLDSQTSDLFGSFKVSAKVLNRQLTKTSTEDEGVTFTFTAKSSNSEVVKVSNSNLGSLNPKQAAEATNTFDVNYTLDAKEYVKDDEYKITVTATDATTNVDPEGNPGGQEQ